MSQFTYIMDMNKLPQKSMSNLITVLVLNVYDHILWFVYVLPVGKA